MWTKRPLHPDRELGLVTTTGAEIVQDPLHLVDTGRRMVLLGVAADDGCRAGSVGSGARIVASCGWFLGCT
ncbi:MAG: hypothetical protein PVI59_11740 [Anaerolineae bacterium]